MIRLTIVFTTSSLFWVFLYIVAVSKQAKKKLSALKIRWSNINDMNSFNIKTPMVTQQNRKAQQNQKTQRGRRNEYFNKQSKSQALFGKNITLCNPGGSFYKVSLKFVLPEHLRDYREGFKSEHNFLVARTENRCKETFRCFYLAIFTKGNRSRHREKSEERSISTVFFWLRNNSKLVLSRPHCNREVSKQTYPRHTAKELETML